MTEKQDHHHDHQHRQHIREETIDSIGHEPNSNDLMSEVGNTHLSGVKTTQRSEHSPCNNPERQPPAFEVSFGPNDKDNPKNWPQWYRLWTVLGVAFSAWVIVLNSTSYTPIIPGLAEQFRSTTTIVTLGITTYLFGLAVGALVLAPMSEMHGRRPVYLVCMVLSTILIIPAALATSLAEILVVRFFVAFFGAALVSNSPGTVVDVASPKNRTFYMSLWSLASLNGPTTGAIIGGFVFQDLGWRWNSWVVLILSGACIVVMFSIKETYAPALLREKVAILQKETDDSRWWCQYDRKVSQMQLIKTSLGRPFVLACTEPILWFFNIWMSVLYGILYLCFVAYPIIFEEHRGWSVGVSGLGFTGIGIGTMSVVFLEPLLRRLIQSHPRDPVTGKIPPEATGRVMAIGAVLAPIGQLGFTWTSLPTSIHWIAPIIFGVPFGAGNTISFVYGTDYLAGVYGMYAASALAGNAVIRSIFGGLLPLAGRSMYDSLTPRWAGTLLGLLELVLAPVPFVFWRYGKQIRAKSKALQAINALEVVKH
ncbi:MFS general substrate transporter [Aspergillus tamarii]|uniref:MFS general substrate transporter n=1 Tax=Aspergillus tamarii TaxID=41984 RepID=A0A5N6V588_ASPTM|nr:MFS general substrate transporter [Aspergillus tamarii]